jgi:hypothetical protein
MTLAATLLAFALFAGPANSDRAIAHRATDSVRSCVAAERTGTFRVTTQKAGGKDLRLGLIVLENIDGCLEATYITDNASPAAIDGLSMSNNMLKGALRLSGGSAKVSLHFDGANVEGSIVQGRNQWSVAGRRTS